MRRTFYEKHRHIFDKFNGFLFENPILEKGLILGPAVVVSYTFENSIMIGIAFFFITFFTVLLSVIVSNRIPYTIRIIIYSIIACIIFIPTAMYMEKLYPDTLFSLGIFLPLLVVNSLILIKSESRFHKKKTGTMIFDLFFHTLGFLFVVVIIGFFRDLLTDGVIFDIKILEFKMPAIAYPFAGFILIGFLSALIKNIHLNLQKRKLSE